MELEGGEAFVDALFDVALVLVHRVPGHGRRVGGHPRAVAAQHLPDGQAGLLGFDVPGELVDDAQMRHVHLVDAVDLPDQVEQPLGGQRILADQALQPALRELRDRVRVAGRGLDLHRAADALVSVHAKHGGDLLRARHEPVMRAHEPVAPAIAVDGLLGLEKEAADVGDAHCRRSGWRFGLRQEAFAGLAGTRRDAPQDCAWRSRSSGRNSPRAPSSWSK